MSLSETYDRENIFAKIIRGDMPAIKLAETEATIAFTDVFPQSEGHSLMIPKNAEVVNFLDVGADDLTAVILETQRIARAVEKALSPDGVRIIQFNGASAGQTVFHLHFHVIPVYEGQALGAHASGGPASATDLQPVADKIIAAL